MLLNLETLFTFFINQAILMRTSTLLSLPLRRRDTLHNDTEHNDTQHNNTQHNDNQHNDIQHDDK